MRRTLDVVVPRPWAASILVLTAAGLLLLAATGGPDCLRYLDWSRAARTGDIFELNNAALSPVGVPLSQWSHGPGLLFALPRLLPWPYGHVPAALLGPLDDFRGIGWIAALLTWWALLRTARHLLPRARTGPLFIAAAGFFGTHLGFYSSRHASESLTFACLALLTCWTVVPRRWRAPDISLVGVLCGLLVMIRPHLGLYLLPAAGLLYFRLRERPLEPGAARRVPHALLLLLPLALALAQVALVNRWMTGSLLRSPYDFGAGAFASLNWRHPELPAVLLHPWHGLLVYHPFYAVAFALLLVELWRERHRPLGRLYGLLTLSIVAHLYLQASWYVWWMGIGTFGMRGLGAAAIPLIVVVAHALARRLEDGRELRRLLWGIVAVCVWSYLLMCQGMTNFATIGELLRAQLDTLLRIEVGIPLLFASLLAVPWRRSAVDPSNRPFSAPARLLAALCILHLAGIATALRPELLYLRIALALGGIVALQRLTWLPAGGQAAPRTGADTDADAGDASMSRGFARFALPAVMIAVFLVATLLFARLAYRTERRLAAVESHEPLGIGAGVDLREVEDAFREYQFVPGFQDKKAALEEFLARARNAQRESDQRR